MWQRCCLRLAPATGALVMAAACNVHLSSESLCMPDQQRLPGCIMQGSRLCCSRATPSPCCAPNQTWQSRCRKCSQVLHTQQHTSRQHCSPQQQQTRLHGKAAAVWRRQLPWMMLVAKCPQKQGHAHTPVSPS
jgi:hypothetical protein